MNNSKRKEYLKRYYERNKKRVQDYQNKNRKIITIKRKIYYKNNRKRLLAQKRLYAKENSKQIAEYKKLWYDRNRKVCINKMKVYYKSNKKNIIKNNSAYKRSRRKEDLLFCIKEATCNMIRASINRMGYTKKSRTMKILGCSYLEFKKYIEKQFSNGMNWANREMWHFDHIKPLSLAKSEYEVYKLNHFTNIQPLWATTDIARQNGDFESIGNLEKGDKWNDVQESLSSKNDV